MKTVKQTGFSLMSLSVSLLIISFLAVTAMPMYSSFMQAYQEVSLRNNMLMIDKGMRYFKAHLGWYPMDEAQTRFEFSDGEVQSIFQYMVGSRYPENPFLNNDTKVVWGGSVPCTKQTAGTIFINPVSHDGYVMKACSMDEPFEYVIERGSI